VLSAAKNGSHVIRTSNPDAYYGRHYNQGREMSDKTRNRYQKKKGKYNPFY
jgi:hypothetical protein